MKVLIGGVRNSILRKSILNVLASLNNTQVFDVIDDLKTIDIGSFPYPEGYMTTEGRGRARNRKVALQSNGRKSHRDRNKKGRP